MRLGTIDLQQYIGALVQLGCVGFQFCACLFIEGICKLSPDSGTGLYEDSKPQIDQFTGGIGRDWNPGFTGSSVNGNS